MITFKFLEKRNKEMKMILSNVYEKFVEHTGLKDAIYKTVFIQIGDVLNYIKDIKWIRIKYNIGSENYIHNFTSDEEIPLYVVEIMQNLFDASYSFPESSIIELELEYKGMPYKIECKKDEVNMASEISFIDEYSLLDFFLVTRKVFDIFDEFDNLFEFVETFRAKVDKIFPPLKNKFEDQVGHEEIDKGNISESNISSINTLIENLKKSRNDILTKLDELTDIKSKLVKSKNEILKAVRSKKGFELERKNMTNEYEILKEDYDSYKKNLYKIIDMVAEIDSRLQDMATNEEILDIDEREHLKDKKAIFVKEQKDLEETLNNTKNIIDNVKLRLVEINNYIKKVQHYTMNDVDIVAQRIEDVDKKHKETYISLVTIENELKQQSIKVSTDSVQIEKEKNRTSLGMDKVDAKDIVTHLSNPLQPVSVTVVINYLRYFFAYYTSKISVDLMKMYEDFDAPTIQAVASRLVLIKFFGVYYNNIFSSVKFVDNRIKTITFVNGQEV
jgi:hypothetical protein